MSLNRFRLLGTYAHWMLNAKLHGKNATVSFAWFKLISYNAAKRHLVQKQFSSMGCEFLFKDGSSELAQCLWFIVSPFRPPRAGFFIWPAIVSAGRPIPADGPPGRFGFYVPYFRGVSSLGCIPGRPTRERPCAELPHGCRWVCFQHKTKYKTVAVYVAHGVSM